MLSATAFARGLRPVGLIRWSCLCVMFIAGCQTPERAAIQPLSDDARPLSYDDLAFRVKSQVSAAQEFFFRDQWQEVEQAGEALQETAVHLTKLDAAKVPANRRDGLNKHSEELITAAKALQAAGKAKDVHKTNDALQQLNLKVRDLRPD